MKKKHLKSNGEPIMSRLARTYRADRRRNLGIAIDHAWSSLRSHLSDAVKTAVHPNAGNERWHAQCCFEYAQIIYTNATELYELTKVDFPEAFTPQNTPIRKRAALSCSTSVQQNRAVACSTKNS